MSRPSSSAPMERPSQSGAAPMTALQYVFELQQDWIRITCCPRLRPFTVAQAGQRRDLALESSGHLAYVG